MYRWIALLTLALVLVSGGAGYAQERGWATAIAWSPDGDNIAVGSSTGVWFFDTEFNETGFVATPELAGMAPDSIDWNAEGDLFAISLRNNDAPILIISAQSLHVINRIPADIPLSLRWRPEENIILSVSFFEVVVWDALTGEELIHIDLSDIHEPDARHFNHLYSGCWLNNDLIALAGDYDIIIVRVSDQEVVKTFGNSGTGAIDCYQDEKLATSYGLVFDIDDGRRLVKDSHLATLDDYAFEYVSVAWSPDGSKIVANGNGGLCRFGVFDGDTIEIIAELQGSYSRVHDYLRYADSVAWHPDGSRFATLGQFDIRLWDAETFTLLRRFAGFDVPFYPSSMDENWSEAERIEYLHSHHVKCPEL